MNDDFKRPLGPTSKVKEAQPVEGEPPVTMGAPTPVVKEKKKHSKAFSFVSVLFLLAILGTGVMTYFWYYAENRLDDARNEVSTLQSSLSSADAKLTDLPADTEPTESNATDNDKAAIEQAVIAAVQARVANEEVKPQVNILKQNAEWAYVGVGFGEGGARNILKKVNDTWVIVSGGNGEVPQEDIDAYGIPEEYQSGQ